MANGRAATAVSNGRFPTEGSNGTFPTEDSNGKFPTEGSHRRFPTEGSQRKVPTEGSQRKVPTRLGCRRSPSACSETCAKKGKGSARPASASMCATETTWLSALWCRRPKLWPDASRARLAIVCTCVVDMCVDTCIRWLCICVYVCRHVYTAVVRR